MTSQIFTILEIATVFYFAVGLILHLRSKWIALDARFAPVAIAVPLQTAIAVQPTPVLEPLVDEPIFNVLEDLLTSVFDESEIPVEELAIAHVDLDSLTLAELRSLPLAVEVPNAGRLNAATLRKRLKALYGV